MGSFSHQIGHFLDWKAFSRTALAFNELWFFFCLYKPQTFLSIFPFILNQWWLAYAVFIKTPYPFLRYAIIYNSTRISIHATTSVTVFAVIKVSICRHLPFFYFMSSGSRHFICAELPSYHLNETQFFVNEKTLGYF
jgi:hypothetical protein